MHFTGEVSDLAEIASSQSLLAMTGRLPVSIRRCTSPAKYPGLRGDCFVAKPPRSDRPALVSSRKRGAVALLSYADECRYAYKCRYAYELHRRNDTPGTLRKP
jgi:hypothetical protein